MKQIKRGFILRKLLATSVLKQRQKQLIREGGTYQKIDSAAHAIVATVIPHDGAVVKETNEETLHQGDEVLHLWLQHGLFSRTVQQSGRETCSP